MAALNLWAVLCESKRIINAHSRHFLALSVIFLLPLSFSLIVSPTLFHLFSPSSSSTSRIHILLRTTTSHHHHHQQQPPIDIKISTLIFPLAFSLFLLLTSLCALSSITHSVLHGFFGRPVKLPSALLSTLSSFLPLLTTQLLSHLLLFLPTLPIILFLPQTQTQTLTSSPIFLFLYSFLLIFVVFLLIYLRISWTLAPVIAVAESSYAVRPLRRSAALMRGMKPLGASFLLFFGLLEGLLLWSSSVLVTGSDGGGGAWWKDWALVAQIVMTSTTLMILMLYNIAANTVLYMYCKAVHGELAVEIAEEFAREYVSLPFDDGKVPHVVTVVPHV